MSSITGLPQKIQNVRVSKKEVVYCIQEYFENKGQRLSNLKKANMEQLDKIIIKYNIGFEYMIDSIIKHRHEVHIEKQQEKVREQQRAIEREERERLRMKEKETNDRIIQSIHIKLRETISNKYKVVAHINYLEIDRKQKIEDRLMKDEREKTLNCLKEKYGTDRVSYNRTTGSYRVRGINLVLGFMGTNYYNSYEHYYECHQFHKGYILAINARGQHLIPSINSYYKKYRFQRLPTGSFKMIKNL
jgi:hypothetical protein